MGETEGEIGGRERRERQRTHSCSRGERGGEREG